MVVGKGINGTIIAGRIEKAKVIAIDKNGNLRTSGGDRVKAFMVNPATGNAFVQDVFDNMNGTYEINLKQTVAGLFDLHVLLHGVPIERSPFFVHVKPNMAHGSSSTIRFTPYSSFPDNTYFLTTGDSIFLKFLAQDKYGNEIPELTQTTFD